MTAQELLRIHLERNPDDVRTALDMVAAAELEARNRQRDQEERDHELLKAFIGHDFVRGADIAPLRDRLVGSSDSHPALAVGPTNWDAPLPKFDPDQPGSPEPAETSLPGLLHLYVVVDGSAAIAPVVDELNAGVRGLLADLARRPDVSAVVRLAVVQYTDAVHEQLPLSRIDGSVAARPLTAQGAARYGPIFEYLRARIPDDVTTLKALTPSLRRPQVFFLTASIPIDTDRWAAAHSRLVDRQDLRSAPDITVFAVNGIPAGMVRNLATRPDIGFTAVATDLRASVNTFCEFLGGHVLGYGQAVLDGDSGPVIRPPTGFLPVIDGSEVAG